ncbi:MAG: TetR/AcrR family transcriptional regulator [Hyphomicrobiaceae bacterium]|nr:TetR/AcrR family transcriptional regulator [Hyphomicrobiaceae bacterium]
MLDKKASATREQTADIAPGRRTRADRALETRRKLIDAAAKVVGAEGYANASVAKITALAEIAQGTFYNYFASQQDLFDHLLPELGGELLDFIRARVGNAEGLRREEIGFRAFFDFLAQRPEFYRILNEAETFSPKAFHDHMRNMAAGYMRALSRSHADGAMPGFETRELEVIVYMLLAARNYLSFRYVYDSGRARRLPAWVERAYMKLVAGGMRYGGAVGPARRKRPSEIAKPAAGSLRDRLEILIEPGSPGETSLTVDLTDHDRDDDGAVRRSVLLEIVEHAASSAAAAGADGPLRLQSLSTGFPAPTAVDTLVALAQSSAVDSVVHVSVSVRELARTGRTIAVAQAVYSAGQEEGA